MNTTNQNHIDNLFKQVLNSPPEFKPSDKNWLEMERLLKPGAKRRVGGWIYTVSGIAAALLLFLSLWLVPKEPAKEDEHLQTKANSGNRSSVSGEVGSDRESNDSQHGTTIADDGGNNIFPKAAPTLLSGNNRRSTDRAEKNVLLSGSQAITDRRLPVTFISNVQYAGIHSSFSGKFASQHNIRKSNVPANSVNKAANKSSSPDIEIAATSGKWALSLAVSPDVNSVKGIDNGDMGRSMGVGVSYRLGKVLSVGTGIYYSKKLYSADKTSYKVTEKPFATWTSYSKRIEADCRVIDVPLNLTLRVSNKTQNKLYATAGMSSYVMLSEKYDFIYNNPSPAFPTGRREYTIRNQNKHLLSVVNLGIALERPLSEQVSLVIQPYAKLPLTGIGQGETDLKSFGLGLKLNYSLKKKESNKW